MLSNRIINYLGTLTLSGGDCDGQLFRVLPWERQFIRGTFGQSGDSALSIGRGNGKSALVAGISTAVVDPGGPLHGKRREVLIVASSFDQGRVIFEDCQSFLREKFGELNRRTWKVEDSANKARITHKDSGARVVCIGSDPRRAHGRRPALCLIDEPSQHEPNKRDRMLAAIRTGLGKVPGSRLIALGTRSSDPTHWFSRMLDGEAGYSQQHSAGDDDKPFLMRTIRKANPSLSVLPSLKSQILVEAEQAKRDSAALSSFKALRLNQGVSEVERQHLLEASTWTNCEVETGAMPATDGGYILGVDLGGGRAMSAVAAYWPDSGRLEALAMFPSVPDLTERGLRDGVGDLYIRMNDRAELITYPGAWVPVKPLLQTVESRWGHPVCVVADRWREAELRQGLNDADYPLCRLELRGQGFFHGGEDVKNFREAILMGKVRPIKSLLLRSAMAEAVTVSDAAGNEKLAKASEGGRRFRAKDDAVMAAILAVSAGNRQGAEPEDDDISISVGRRA